MAIAKRKAHAAFELMDKLDIDYFCFHDRDIAPEAANPAAKPTPGLTKSPTCWPQLMRKAAKRCCGVRQTASTIPATCTAAGLRPTPTCSLSPRRRLRKRWKLLSAWAASGYVFWGGREGYETLLNTDMALEQDNMARLMRMTVDYARSIGYTGDFYIEPKPKEPTKHQYDFDASTVLSLLTQIRPGQGLQAEHRGQPRHPRGAHLPARAGGGPRSTGRSARSTPIRAICCWDGTPTNSPPTSTRPPCACWRC